MSKEIENQVMILIGKSLWTCRRAGDMATFQFGARRKVTDFYGTETEVGEYALHVQCAWRISKDDQVLVGSRDLYYPASYDDNHEDIPADFDWDRDLNRRDRLLLSLFENGTRAFVVTSVQVGVAGSMRVMLSEGLFLDVFPDDSLGHEFWRLLRPGVDEPHLVMGGRGLDKE